MHTPKSHGFTLIEILVVMVVIGLLAGVAVPRLYDLSHRFEIASQRDNLVLAIGNIGYRAYQTGQPLRLNSTGGTASNGAEAAVSLPPGWQIELVKPIDYSFNGICSGGSITLHGPDGYLEQLVLTAPLCQTVPGASTGAN